MVYLVEVTSWICLADQFHTFGASAIFAKVERDDFNTHPCSDRGKIQEFNAIRPTCINLLGLMRGIALKRQYISNEGIELQTSPQIQDEAVEIFGNF
jgi:hypothetical protein